MDVVAGDGTEGELRSEPFPERDRWGHLGPVEFGLAASKDIQIHLGDKGAQFNDLGVVQGNGREAINIAKTQAHMAISLKSGEGITKCGVQREQRRGRNNT